MKISFSDGKEWEERSVYRGRSLVGTSLQGRLTLEIEMAITGVGSVCLCACFLNWNRHRICIPHLLALSSSPTTSQDKEYYCDKLLREANIFATFGKAGAPYGMDPDGGTQHCSPSRPLGPWKSLFLRENCTRGRSVWWVVADAKQLVSGAALACPAPASHSKLCWPLTPTTSKRSSLSDGPCPPHLDPSASGCDSFLSDSCPFTTKIIR